MQIKNRVKELRQVKASELLPNPKNWRTHPVGQSDLMKGVLAQIGYADALIAYETDEGLMLIDGHLRAETTPEMEVPVLVTDLNEEEASTLLATLDPLASMARTNHDALSNLIDSINIDNIAINAMLTAITEGVPEFIDEVGETPNLDELASQYGEFDPESLYPEIRIKVPPDVKDRFDEWRSTGNGETEGERLADLLS